MEDLNLRENFRPPTSLAVRPLQPNLGNLPMVTTPRLELGIFAVKGRRVDQFHYVAIVLILYHFLGDRFNYKPDYAELMLFFKRVKLFHHLQHFGFCSFCTCNKTHIVVDEFKQIFEGGEK